MNKPRLSFLQIWNMNFGFVGIQFGFGLQLANMSAIYAKLGAEPSKIPILWLAGPMTGLLVQPIIGSLSDRTWNKLGRRRPYFLVGAILSSLALFFMPDAPALWVAATMLWVLDASINISMEPFRAFVADKLPDDQRTTGFVMQSFFIGIGAAIANVLPTIFEHFGVTGNAANGVPFTVQYAFKLGAFAFLLAVLWTVFTTKEYPPEDMEAFLRKTTGAQGLSRRSQVSYHRSAFRNGARHLPRCAGGSAAHHLACPGRAAGGRCDRCRAQRPRSLRRPARNAKDDEATRRGAILHLDGAVLHVALFLARNRPAGFRHNRSQIPRL